MGAIPCHKGTQLRKLFLRVLGQIQLKAEGASKCCRHPCFHRGDVAGAVVGHGGKVCAHHTAGVEQAGAILDDQAAPGIGVVAAPDLGAVIEHSAVEPCPAACTVFQQQVGVFLGQAALQFVHPQHIPVVHLALPLGRQSGTVHLRQTAVHVPLEVFQRAALQDGIQLLPDAIYHLRAAEIQRVLLPDLQRLPAGNAERPVWVGTVEVTVRADGLRFHPKPHVQPQQVDLFAQAGQTLRQLAGVRCPVAQTGRRIVASLEPAIVQHKQVDVCLFGSLRQCQQLLLVKIEVAGLPAVDEHRTGLCHILPAGRQQPGADGIVEPAAHLA